MARTAPKDLLTFSMLIKGVRAAATVSAMIPFNPPRLLIFGAAARKVKNAKRPDDAGRFSIRVCAQTYCVSSLLTAMDATGTGPRPSF